MSEAVTVDFNYLTEEAELLRPDLKLVIDDFLDDEADSNDSYVSERDTTITATSAVKLRELAADSMLCAQTDPEAFYPEKGGSTRAAKQVCLRCDIREKCLQWALDTDQRFGVWGGTSERERRAIKKQQKLLAAADSATE